MDDATAAPPETSIEFAPHRTASLGAAHAGDTRGARSPLRRSLLVFAVACLVISVGCWAAAVVVAGGAGVRSTPASFALFAIGTAGPSLAALVAVLAVRAGSFHRVQPQTAWAWIPLSIVLPALPAIVAETVLAPGAFGSHAAAIVASTGGAALFIASSLVAGPLAEELGWRGFLQPRLRVRFGPVRTALVVGAAWGAWHVPLFFMPGTGQSGIGLLTVPGMLFLVSAVPLSFTFLVLSEALGGGVFAAVLAHASLNVSLTLLPQPSVAGAVIQFTAVCLVAIGAALVLSARSRKVASFAVGGSA